MNIVPQDNSNRRGRRRGIHYYTPVSLSTWGKRVQTELANSGRRRRDRLYIKDTRRTQHSYDGSTVRHFRLEVTLNTIKRYGLNFFVYEVGQLLQQERKARGYYPALPEVYAIIEREFGKDFAEQSRGIALTLRLRWRRVFYSPPGAKEYHAQTVSGTPLVDLDAPYKAPFGTVRDYLYWRLPRMLVHDRFEVNGVSIRRVDDAEFSISGRGVNRSVSGEGFSHAVARVLMALRSSARDEPVSDLPVVYYRNVAERMYLSQMYQAKGYTLAQIQAALQPLQSRLTRPDLAAKGDTDLQ